MSSVVKRIRQPRAKLALLDVLVAGALSAGGLVDVAALPHQTPVALAATLSVACTSSVAWRRRSAGMSACVATSAMALYQIATRDPRMTFEPYALALTFYMVGRHEFGRNGHRTQTMVLAYALAAFGLTLAGAHSHESWIFDALSAWIFFVALPCGIGALVSRHIKLTRELARQTTLLKIEQQLRASELITEERQRVARDLHDVIAHYVSVMIIQASAARLIASNDAGATHNALRVVEVSGREAMIDLRRITGVVHHNGNEIATDLLGVAQLQVLVDHARDAGIATELHFQGTVVPLPPQLDLAAFRVAQEALTNVVKHAPRTSARIEVTFTPHTLELLVLNTASPSRPHNPDLPRSGHGLTGMRERVAVCGGHLEAGPKSDGGYSVHATVPLTPPTPQPRETHSTQTDSPEQPNAARHWQWIDVALASAWLVALETEVFTSSHRRGSIILNLFFVGAMALAGLWRRSAPLVFLIGTGLLTIPLSQGLTSREYATLAGVYSVLIPTYTAGAWTRGSRAIAGLAAWACLATLLGLLQHAPFGGIVGPLMAACAAWTAGRVIGSQRDLATQLRLTSTRLAAEREDRARLAAISERTRIARELHAFVARDVTAMVIQAEAAQSLLDSELEQAIDAITAIEMTGRETLSQMRRILGVLRNRNEDRELRPQPGLGQMRALVKRLCQAGKQIELTIEGEPATLLAGLDVLTYRLLEEALANLDREDGPVVVTLHFNEDSLELHLNATGSMPSAWLTVAMHERVALCNAEMTALPSDESSRVLIRMSREPQAALT